MAKFFLLNTIFVGTSLKFAGQKIDDAQESKPAIEAAGGVLWPESDTVVAAAASRAQDARKRAAPIAMLDMIMMSATLGRENANKARRRLPMFFKPAADGAASTATAETPFYRAQDAETITALQVVPGAALTADAANNATITVRKRLASGADGGVVATLVTDIAGGSWVQWVAKSLGAITNGSLAAGDFLTIAIAKGGTGVVVPISIIVATSTMDL